MTTDLGSKYAFLFKKTKLPKVNLGALFRIDDFVLELEKFENKWDIDDDIVYDIAKKLYFPMRADNKRSSHSRILYNAIKRFARVLDADENVWKAEFMEYIDNDIWHCKAFDLTNSK